MNLVERYFAPSRGAIREFVGINAFFEPADVGLYASLLPAPFSVPDKPLVIVAAADYLKAAPWPLTRWQEWGVLLMCEWHGNPGWYPVTTPVTKWLPMSAGRYLGYPKYVADSISLAGHGDSWSARAVHRDVQQLAMEFQPAIAQSPQTWSAELLSDESFFKGDVYVVVPPGTGSSAQRISFSFVEQLWTSKSGTVQLEVDPNESWASLVPRHGSLPGQSCHFVGGLNLVAGKLGSAA
jgi:hypothetical protein